MPKDDFKHFTPLEIVVYLVRVFSLRVHVPITVHTFSGDLDVALIENMIARAHDCDNATEHEAEGHARHALPGAEHHDLEYNA